MWIGPVAMSRSPHRELAVKAMLPAGDRPALGWRGRRSRLRVRSGVLGGLPSRPPPTQAEPSRRGPGRQGRSYSGAPHLDALNHARSTVCRSTADGMGAGGAEVGGLWPGTNQSRPWKRRRHAAQGKATWLREPGAKGRRIEGSSPRRRVKVMVLQSCRRQAPCGNCRPRRSRAGP